MSLNFTATQRGAKQVITLAHRLECFLQIHYLLWLWNSDAHFYAKFLTQPPVIRVGPILGVERQVLRRRLYSLQCNAHISMELIDPTNPAGAFGGVATPSDVTEEVFT